MEKIVSVNLNLIIKQNQRSQSLFVSFISFHWKIHVGWEETYFGPLCTSIFLVVRSRRTKSAKRRKKTSAWRANVSFDARSGTERRTSATFVETSPETRTVFSISSRDIRRSFRIVSNAQTYVCTCRSRHGVISAASSRARDCLKTIYITYLWIPYLLTGCFPQKPYCFLVNTINLARKNFFDAFPRYRHG